MKLVQRFIGLSIVVLEKSKEERWNKLVAKTLDKRPFEKG